MASATNWKAYDLNSSGQALRSRQGDRVAGAVSGFSFNAFPATTSYFLTDQPSYRGTLLGDLTNKTITARESSTFRRRPSLAVTILKAIGPAAKSSPSRSKAAAVAVPWVFDKQPNIESADVNGINQLWNEGAWDYDYTSLK